MAQNPHKKQGIIAMKKTMAALVPFGQGSELSKYPNPRIYSPRCKVCSMQNPDTEAPLVEQIEFAYLSAKHDGWRILLMNNNVPESLWPSEMTILRHMKDHAPYKEFSLALQAQTKQYIQDAVKEGSSVTEAMNLIVSIGTKLIKDGRMPVSDRMLVDVIKTQAKAAQGPVGDIKSMVLNVQQNIYNNGKKVEDTTIEGETNDKTN